MASAAKDVEGILLLGALGVGGYFAWKAVFGQSSASFAPPAVTDTPVPTAVALSPVTQVAAATGALPRGIRNNNPGNIKASDANAWVGQIGNDGTFAQFDTPVNGLRALFRLLINYRNSGLDTITKIANKWAPSSENDSAAYARGVATFAGMGKDVSFDALDGNAYAAIAHGIIAQENGAAWEFVYPPDMMVQALAMAGS